MRRGFFSQQVSSAVGTTRPIRLDSAVAGWAGGKDFGAAARAEDKVILNCCTAAWAGSHRHLGFDMPGFRVDWHCVKKVGVMKKMVSTH